MKEIKPTIFGRSLPFSWIFRQILHFQRRWLQYRACGHVLDHDRARGHVHVRGRVRDHGYVRVRDCGHAHGCGHVRCATRQQQAQSEHA